MKLVIDLGNTRLKWAMVASGKWQFGGAIPYHHQDFKTALKKAWVGLRPHKVAFCSVAGEVVTQQLQDFIRETWQLIPIPIQSQTQYGNLKNGYLTPLLLGADRWAAVAAGWELCQKPLVVLGCGTAITTDVVNADGELVGGNIAPGLNLMREALVNRAAKLQSLTLDFFRPGETYFPDFQAKETGSAICSGILLMASAFLKQTTLKLKEEYGFMPRVLITGGDAEFLLPNLEPYFEHEPYLTLKGVHLLSEIQPS